MKSSTTFFPTFIRLFEWSIQATVHLRINLTEDMSSYLSGHIHNDTLIYIHIYTNLFSFRPI